MTRAALLGLLGCLAGCSSSGLREDPLGSFGLGSTAFTLEDGALWLEHTASSDDPRHYVVEGSFKYTLEFSNEDNETSYGHLDLTVTGITLDGAPGSSLEITSLYAGDDVRPGDALPGWWKWTGLVDYGGKMQLRFNVPATKHRSEDPFSGSDWLIVGDPR